MPNFKRTNSPSIAIELNEALTFKAGDVITGHVVCTGHVVSPRAWLHVTFTGTSRVKIRTDDGNGTIRDYESCSGLISEPVMLTVFDGPIHIPPGPTPEQHKSWPFSITIPHHRCPQDCRSRQPTTTICHKQSQAKATPPPYSRLPSEPLPASFTITTTDIWSKTTHASVSYHLTARFHEEHNSHATQTATTTLAIAILPSSIPVLFNSPLHAQTSKHTIYSQRLLGRDNLSLWERFSKSIHAPGVARYEFEVVVSCPSELQLGNGPFSFQVGIIPVSQSESLGPLEMAGHTVKLERLVLKLGARTDVTCPEMGLVGFKTGEERGVVNVVWKLVGGVSLPCTPDEAWDIGRAKGLNFGGSEAMYCDEMGREGGKETKLPYLSRLYEDFATANIRHWHELKWEMKLVVAEETVNVKGSRRVIILGSSS